MQYNNTPHISQCVSCKFMIKKGSSCTRLNNYTTILLSFLCFLSGINSSTTPCLPSAPTLLAACFIWADVPSGAAWGGSVTGVLHSCLCRPSWRIIYYWNLKGYCTDGPLSLLPGGRKRSESAASWSLHHVCFWRRLLHPHSQAFVWIRRKLRLITWTL